VLIYTWVLGLARSVCVFRFRGMVQKNAFGWVFEKKHSYVGK